jgi:hypothetical protein
MNVFYTAYPDEYPESGNLLKSIHHYIIITSLNPSWPPFTKGREFTLIRPILIDGRFSPFEKSMIPHERSESGGGLRRIYFQTDLHSPF